MDAGANSCIGQMAEVGMEMSILKYFLLTPSKICLLAVPLLYALCPMRTANC